MYDKGRYKISGGAYAGVQAKEISGKNSAARTHLVRKLLMKFANQVVDADLPIRPF